MQRPPSPQRAPGCQYPIQVAGHQRIRQSTVGRILKPWSRKEEAFYRAINDERFPAHLHWMRSVTPLFYGVQHAPCGSDRWIELQDLNHPFVTPCVMDVKIGFRHYDDDACAQKRERQIDAANSTTTATCGVRFVGTRSFKRSGGAGGDRGHFVVRDKWHGRALSEEELLPEVVWFFSDGLSFDARSARLALDALQRICRQFARQKQFCFYSSSMLFIYEGAKGSAHYPRVDVRMIDFSHTVDSAGLHDTGYLKGLEYMVRLLCDAVDTAPRTARSADAQQ